jgi:hypothetical protein
MSARSGHWAWGLLVTGALAGCGQAPALPAGSDAREVVQDYHAALLRHDWSGAYATLHPDIRKRYSSDQFAQLARQHLQHLGFEPTTAYVRSCEERGAEASARVLYEGRDASGRKLYKDAMVLRLSEAGWGIVLPSNFGRQAGKGMVR